MRRVRSPLTAHARATERARGRAAAAAAAAPGSAQARRSIGGAAAPRGGGEVAAQRSGDAIGAAREALLRARHDLQAAIASALAHGAGQPLDPNLEVTLRHGDATAQALTVSGPVAVVEACVAWATASAGWREDGRELDADDSGAEACLYVYLTAPASGAPTRSTP